MKKISVIVPVYNVEEYLHRCVDSILLQTHKDLEVILINDGSTDNSGRICDWYKNQDHRIKVVHKENGGLSSARNAGLDIANGEYIGFVDSDDWIAHDMYEYMLNLIDDTGSDVAVINYILVNDVLEYSQERITYKTYEGKEILREYLLEGTKTGSYSFCRNLYKKDLFYEIRFPVGKINEDIATNYMVLTSAKRMVKSNYAGYFYFQDSFSTTRGGLKKRDFDLLDACEELSKLTVNENYKDIKYLAKVKYARSYFSLLAKIAYYGIDDDIDRKETISFLTKNLRQKYFLLILSPMPLNRKIMLTALCINFNLLSVPLNFYRNVLEK
jgi:glycosyltransferase involved in cell wall biosynthesis